MDHTFDGCKNSKEISIPSSVTKIDEHAFQDCEKLEELIIPSSVTIIGDGFVSGCYSLKMIEIPSSVQIFPKIEFHDFSLLREFKNPSSIKKIDEKAFDKCTSLMNIEIPPSVTIIERLAFSNCSSLKEITIPPSVKVINDYTFFKCTSLTKVNIPTSVTFIEFNAFCLCKSLVNITIPSTVKSIGLNAFNGCDMLNKIDIQNSIGNSEKVEIKAKKTVIKALILGASCVGKSCFLLRYSDRKFTEVNMATIGVDFKVKMFKFNGKSVKLQIWDTAGIEKFHSITKAYYRGADSIVVVFDLTWSETFKRVEEYLEEVYDSLNPISAILLGNKCDLENNIKVTDEEIHKLETKYNIKCFKVSAKDDKNVDDAFYYLADLANTNIVNEQKRIETFLNITHDDNNNNGNNGNGKQKKCIIS